MIRYVPAHLILRLGRRWARIHAYVRVWLPFWCRMGRTGLTLGTLGAEVYLWLSRR